MDIMQYIIKLILLITTLKTVQFVLEWNNWMPNIFGPKKNNEAVAKL